MVLWAPAVAMEFLMAHSLNHRQDNVKTEVDGSFLWEGIRSSGLMPDTKERL